jgi:regulator of protease activity HflC (stomatin/prohibitin superfamily)
MFKKLLDDHPGFIKKASVIVLVTIIAIILLCSSISIIGPTERGIKLTFGKASEEILQPGLNFKTPFAQSIKKHSLEPIVYSIEFSIGSDSAITSDMQSVGLTASVIWTYDEAKLYEVVTKYTSSSLKDAISKSMLASIKESVGKYTIYEIVENQEKISQEIQSALVTKMNAYPIIISQVAISNWDWSAEFDAQISETMRTTQQVKIAEQELQITQQEAQKQIKEAEAEKEAALIKANAEKEQALIKAETELETAKLNAEAQKVEADAIAYYNQKVAENLEVELELRKLENQAAEIEKWNGQYVSTYQYGTIPVTTGSIMSPTN